MNALQRNFSQFANFKNGHFGNVCEIADVTLTPCRRSADVLLTLPLTLASQEGQKAACFWAIGFTLPVIPKCP